MTVAPAAKAIIGGIVVVAAWLAARAVLDTPAQPRRRRSTILSA